MNASNLVIQNETSNGNKFIYPKNTNNLIVANNKTPERKDSTASAESKSIINYTNVHHNQLITDKKRRSDGS